MTTARGMLVYAVALTLIRTASSGSAQQFEVDGNLTYTLWPQKSPPRDVRKAFTVAVDGCKSLIRTANVGSSNYVEAGFDGTDIFTVDSQWVNVNGILSNLVSATIERRPTPKDDSSNINYLWLAYGSSCYFDSITNSMLLPVWTLDDPQLVKEQFKLPGSWIRLPGERLARVVAYYGDGFWHIRQKEGPMSVRVPVPFDTSFTNAIYNTVQITNFFGSTFPLEFFFARFGLRRTENGLWEASKLTQTRARVTHVRALTSHRTFFPRFDGVLYASDNRFATADPSVPSLTYRLTNGDWLSVPQLTSEYRKESRVSAAIKKAELMDMRVRKPKAVVVSLALLLVAALPIATIIWRHMKTSKC